MNRVLIIIPTLDPKKGASTGKLAKLSAGCAAELVRVRVVHDSRGLGFTKAVNHGLSIVRDDEDICFLNDDINAFQFGWLRLLSEALYSRADYGIVGPSGRSASAPKRGVLGDRGLVEVPHLPFWCVLVKKQVFEQLGLLDERFIHYSSDTWYCARAIAAHWKCVWLKSVFLWHQHQGSGYKKKWRAHDSEVLKKLRGQRR